MKEKLISFCVPCYNSEKDMKKCLDSLLSQQEKVEIIIIDDGSTDSTSRIADDYALKYPECIKVIHQENHGHGSGINRALEVAVGKFFKVVDSDDWVDQDGYALLLSKIEKFGDSVDLFVTDYAYFCVDHVRKVIGYNHVFKTNEIIGWDKVRRFPAWENLTLHSAMYRRQILLDSNIKMPEHTFYEDNYFVYASLRNVKNIYYLPVTFYMYFIGREDQSVSEIQLRKRYQNHYLIATLMNNVYNPFKYKKLSKGLYNTMIHHLVLINSIAYIYTRINGSEDAIQTYRKLIKETKKEHPKLYRTFKYRSIAGFVMADGPLGRALLHFSLRISRKVVPFNRNETKKSCK